MIEVRNITKKYSKITALSNVSFKIPQNSITGIIGPNGAGKSTLLEIITGFQIPDSGDIYLDGKALSSFFEKKMIISYMPEHLEIYPDYRVINFINFIQKATGYINHDLIDVLNLKSIFSRKIRYLSKGYHQRLKLFFTLSNNKKIIVLDEPFDGFDPIQLIDILEFIKKENQKGRTFILSIHQLHDAEKICNYYVLLNRGVVLIQGNMGTLKEKFGQSAFSLEEIFIRAMQ